MTHELPKLPYAEDALEPHISAETLKFHYGKHHKTYVDKLNAGVKGTEHEDASLEDVIKKASGGLFNAAAQAWNHTFYWNCLSPKGGGAPQGEAAKEIEKAFGSFDKFKEEFTKCAVTTFGSGWAWLVRKADGKLAIRSTKDAGCPLSDGETPILTCDVWEHAYYIDYRSARPKYVEAFWNLANWEFVAKNLANRKAIAV